jgi:ABC-type bacteriocin/lantibiotic exporter with double-glycine peptidase domain
LARARRAVRAPPAATPWQRRTPEIRCHALTFRHVEGAAPAVAGLDLTVPAGSIVGLIGANGSGKSTVLDLLCGLLVPQSGTIALDGILLTDDNRAAWRAAIAYVPQQIFLMDATVAENVAFGVPRGQIDHERVRAALELAQLTEVIAALPRGCEERLGEHGASLSGGQRQRLGIARAVYRAAPLLILDEATSALDAAAERVIIASLIAHATGLGSTVVLAAHRLAALRSCDVIYELAAGRLVRRTSFAQLAAENQQREPPVRPVLTGVAP